MRGYCYRTPQQPCLVACTSVGSYLRQSIAPHADVVPRHPVIWSVGLHFGLPGKKRSRCPVLEGDIAILQEQSGRERKPTELQSVETHVVGLRLDLRAAAAALEPTSFAS